MTFFLKVSSIFSILDSEQVIFALQVIRFSTHLTFKAGDVWSFGVTLWELFTLGESPYANDVELEGIGSWLSEGNRLETPAFMPRSTAAIMTSCWEARPELRPTFRCSAYQIL